MATGKQREHEWATATVLPEGNGSLSCWPSSTGCCGQEIKYPTARDAAVENPSVYSRHKYFHDPLRPSYPCVRNGPGMDIGAPRFELVTPCTPCKCATRLRHAPTRLFLFGLRLSRACRGCT